MWRAFEISYVILYFDLSLSLSIRGGIGQSDRDRRGWNLSSGGCVRDADDGAYRAVARGPELKTRLDGNARRNSGILEGAGASVSLRSVIFSRYTKAAPSPRCSRIGGGLLSKVSLSSSTSRVSTLGRSRATFSFSVSSLELQLFTHMRTTHTRLLRFTKIRVTLYMFNSTLYIFKLYLTFVRTYFYRCYLKNNNMFSIKAILKKICI